MDIRKLQRAIVDGLEDVKAQAIAVFNTEALSPLFERVIVATGASNRQTKALAASVRDKVRERGLPVMRTEGEENGEWIIVDCGAAVAHVMQPMIRQYYNLEEIWGDKPVRLRSAAPAVARKAPAQAAPAKPAAPPDPMTRLTQEVRALGSQVLPRPADNVSGDLTAQLEVRYAAGGYINSIVVAESSGSQALDEQALGIARMTRFPNAPDELKGQDFVVRFPVVFRSGR